MHISKNLLAFFLILLVSIFLFRNFSFDTNNKIRYSDFMDLVKNRQISKVEIQGEQVRFSLDQKKQLHTIVPSEIKNFAYELYQKGIKVQVKNPEEGGFLWAFLMQWLPILIIIGVWIFIFRNFQGGGGSKIMSMGRFKIRSLEDNPTKYTFADVAGIDEAVDEVREIVEYMRDPGKFQKLGGKIPTGVLLCGSPGTGKTLLAKAIAGEAGIGFFSISGSDFVEMFVGVGAGRVRELFSHARKNFPCIIFIDELDAVGRSRGSGMGGGNDEREQTLNQLLVEMDGFTGKEGIIIIAATNRPDVLDPALTRPGRFDRTVIVPPPDVKGREKILQVHSKKVKLDKDVDLEVVAKSLPTATGADLENIINEAALLAARRKKKKVGKAEFEEARDKVTMGSERRTLSMSPKDIESTAYHEAGHALVAALLKDCDELHKVTIIPRGRALGVTMLMPDEKKHSMSKDKILAVLKMMMGGRGAEEIIYNHFTTGASNDLERANALAHDMICRWGMSDKLGPVYLTEEDQNIFLGQGLPKKKKMSEQISKSIDAEVKRIVNTAYTQTVKLLRKNQKSLEEITRLLLEHETIEASMVQEVIQKNSATA